MTVVESVRLGRRFEIGYMVKKSYRLAVWLNALFDTPMSPFVSVHAKIHEVEQVPLPHCGGRVCYDLTVL